MTLLLTVVSSIVAYGQVDYSVVGGGIHYRLSGTQIDTGYLSNSQNLKSIEKLLAGRSGRIDSITISAWSSPEGSPYLNASLAEKRAASFKNLILSVTGESLAPAKVKAMYVPENWDGLLMLVRKRYFRHDREMVIRILTDGSIGNETRKWRLKQLDGGYTWDFLYRRYMPLLREAVIVNIAYAPADVVPVVASVSGAPALVTGLEEPGLRSLLEDGRWLGGGQDGRKPRGFLMALKTNLLYDLALLPNIGIEFHLGKGWTVGMDYSHAWWDISDRNYFWRLYGGGLELRKYFGKRASRNPMSGHHLGLYTQTLTYDMEFGGRGQISDLTYGGGLEYGYSLPIGRAFNIDLGIGFGYAGGEYKVYDPEDDCYVWKETRLRHYMGPTKAEISLVWILGYKGKGGAR